MNADSGRDAVGPRQPKALAQLSLETWSRRELSWGIRIVCAWCRVERLSMGGWMCLESRKRPLTTREGLGE